MSGDYETLEINQPKISYFKNRLENKTEWLNELINKIEDMKNKISETAQFYNYFLGNKKLTSFCDAEFYYEKLKINKKIHLKYK